MHTLSVSVYQFTCAWVAISRQGWAKRRGVASHSSRSQHRQCARVVVVVQTAADSKASPQDAHRAPSGRHSSARHARRTARHPEPPRSCICKQTRAAGAQRAARTSPRPCFAARASPPRRPEALVPLVSSAPPLCSRRGGRARSNNDAGGAKGVEKMGRETSKPDLQWATGTSTGRGAGKPLILNPAFFPRFPGHPGRRGEEGEVQVAATTSTWTDLRSGYHGRRCVGAGGGGWRARSSRGARVYIGGLC